MKQQRQQAYLINQEKPIAFEFDGRVFHGFQGDTMASALLANGQKLFGRSFKYHRPRGIMGSGVEEMNALAEIGKDEYRDPNNRMTSVEIKNGLTTQSQNRYPSLKCDFGAFTSKLSPIFVSGFYYKTFKYPRIFWEPIYEKFIRKMAGLGRASGLKDPDHYAVHHEHCDMLIVGSGIAGLRGAEYAAKAGLKTLLVEQNAYLGGFLHNCDAVIDGVKASDYIAEKTALLSQYPNLTIKTRTTLVANYDWNFLTALERITDHLETPDSRQPRMRFWKIRAKKVILATGSLERPLVFADNDRPGVMFASAIRDYWQLYGVAVGQKIVIFTNNDSAYASADIAMQFAEVIIVDLRQNPEIAKQYADKKCKIYAGYSITRVHGCGNFANGLQKITICKIHDGKISDTPSVDSIDIKCDVVGMSGGFIPTIHLWSQGRGKMRYDDKIHAFLPTEIPYQQFPVGSLNGADDFNEACQGVDKLWQEIGDSAIKLPKITITSLEKSIKGDAMMHAPSFEPSGFGKSKHFVDYQNDVTSADIALANREGFKSVEHVKRYTTNGMATDQGKTSNLNALALLSQLQGKPIDAIGITTFRPPYTTTNFGAMAGEAIGDLFLQERHTTMHLAHEESQCPYENVGDWKRPWYFPIGNENIHSATHRESLAVRQSVGMVDASTLGKIDIQGKDALKLLNMVYTNDFSKLAVGACKYGLMLNENGMVFDDGVTTRLGENHYHMTTTTGGAGRVMNWLEEWLQGEYPSWQVYCTSVTEQWAVASIAGPFARELLQELCDVSISAADFPFMTMKTGKVANIPARIFRISFTGELSYEINVPARFGLHLWSALQNAGKKYNLTLYGTESMHILRAEKGYIIVGQDTDGTITPDDLGMGKMVSKNKDCFGKRSLSRSDTARTDRRQLVGILTTDPNIVLAEGAHVVANANQKPPMDLLGNISSSYFSPILGRSIALGLIKNGRNLMGQKFMVPRMNQSPAEITITDTVFYDKEGKKLHG